MILLHEQLQPPTIRGAVKDRKSQSIGLFQAVSHLAAVALGKQRHRQRKQFCSSRRRLQQLLRRRRRLLLHYYYHQYYS